MPSRMQSQDADVALLRTAAAHVYGAHWRTPLAASVGYSSSLVHAVDTGSRRLTTDLRAGLAAWARREAGAEVERHQARLSALRAVIARFGHE